MQAKNGIVIAVIVVCALAVIYANYLMIPEIPEQEPIVIPDIVIPTAQEIAGAIDIPDSYISLREDLKQQAILICDEDFDLDDIADDLFPSYDDDEIVLTREYVDRRGFLWINIGLDNLDDRRVTMDRVYKVRVDDDYNDKVYLRCIVTSDDGDLETDITYHL